ncbi:MAG: M42 family metallopeptidase [Candidatus Heimdallarchaeota archaeon]
MNLQEIKELQKDLSTLLGVSGYEDDVSDFILNKIESENLADKAWKDKLGNILAIKEGDNDNERILLDAHTDEIGFMISHIERDGFLRFVPVGGWDMRILLGQMIVLRNNSGKDFNGIIGTKPPHLTSASERKKVIEISDLYIDLGMNSKEEILTNNIKIGSIGTLISPFIEFPNNMVCGKAFDDRTGCNVLLHILELLKEKTHKYPTMLFNFAVQEEFGRIGTVPGAYKLNPTIAIAVENTTAADVPGIKKSQIPVYIGKGPAITIADKSIISNPKVNQRLVENAESQNIPYQFKKPMYGLTNAGKIQVSREGVPSTVVSVPCRYIHSPTSLLKLDDIYNTIRLIHAFIQNPANC